jgi:hypothetical protein
MKYLNFSALFVFLGCQQKIEPKWLVKWEIEKKLFLTGRQGYKMNESYDFWIANNNKESKK